DWACLVDQVEKNSEIIVRNVPLPIFSQAPDVKKPEQPGYFGDDYEAYDKAMQKYQQDLREYERKMAEVREKNAPTNALELKKWLAYFRALGAAYQANTVTKDGIETISVAQLDVASLPTVANAEPADEALEAIVSWPIWLPAASAIPNLIKARAAGNEAAAIGALRTLSTSEAI